MVLIRFFLRDADETYVIYCVRMGMYECVNMYEYFIKNCTITFYELAKEKSLVQKYKYLLSTKTIRIYLFLVTSLKQKIFQVNAYRIRIFVRFAPKVFSCTDENKTAKNYSKVYRYIP